MKKRKPIKSEILEESIRSVISASKMRGFELTQGFYIEMFSNGCPHSDGHVTIRKKLKDEDKKSYSAGRVALSRSLKKDGVCAVLRRRRLLDYDAKHRAPQIKKMEMLIPHLNKAGIRYRWEHATLVCE